MNIINSMNKRVKDILGFQRFDSNAKYIKSPYLKLVNYKNCNLLYNILTGEVIKIIDNELDNLNNTTLSWFVSHWYFFPSNVDPKSIAYMLKQKLLVQNKSVNPFNEHFVVLTTTNCNARCFYCYEAGCTYVTMTEQTALDVAKYMIKTTDKPINISWFGGEPLCNHAAINTICNYLKNAGRSYKSSMISNGYLFDQVLMTDIKNLWKLQRVQITLDGTKQVYQNSKNYKNEDPNAFEKVLNNIELLLKNGIHVSIRLNVSIENGDDLKQLCYQLISRFNKYNNIRVYVSGLFENLGDPPLVLNDEQRIKLAKDILDIEKILSDNKLFKNANISLNYRKNHCMADTGSCCVITPVGNLTPCEHYIEDEVCGTIYTGITDHNNLQTWKALIDDFEDCKTCKYYPKCVKLKKCPTSGICNVGKRYLTDLRYEALIKNVYDNFLLKESSK